MCVNPPYPNINKKVIIYNKNVLTFKNIVYNEGSKGNKKEKEKHT